jgi:hypothetical protein
LRDRRDAMVRGDHHLHAVVEEEGLSGETLGPRRPGGDHKARENEPWCTSPPPQPSPVAAGALSARARSRLPGGASSMRQGTRVSERVGAGAWAVTIPQYTPFSGVVSRFSTDPPLAPS